MPVFDPKRMESLHLHDAGLIGVELSYSESRLTFSPLRVSLRRAESEPEAEEELPYEEWKCDAVLRVEKVVSFSFGGGWTGRRVYVDSGAVFSSGERLRGAKYCEMLVGITDVVIFLSLQQGGDLSLGCERAVLELQPTSYIGTSAEA